MKKALLIFVIILLVLLNALVAYIVLDTYVFGKKEVAVEEEISEESDKAEGKNDKDNKGNSDEIVIGIPEEVIREREEAQREYEAALAKTEAKYTLDDDFSEKIDELANPMLEHATLDFSEYIIKEIRGGQIIAAKQGTNLYGVLDLDENELLPFRFEDIEISSDGFYIVKDKGRMGIVDQDGLEVVDNMFDSISELVSGYFLAKTVEPSGKTNSKIFNRSSSLVFSVDKNIISVFEENTNFFKFEDGGKYGIVDINGDERLKPEYDDLILKDGKLYFKQGTQIGVIE